PGRWPRRGPWSSPRSPAVHQAVDLAGRDAVDIRLQHNRHDRLLRAPAGFQEGREVAALPLSRDQQLDLPDPRLPRPRSIPIAMRDPRLRRDLAKLRSDLRGDLGLHQLPRNEDDRFSDEILQAAIAHLRDDLGSVIL